MLLLGDLVVMPPPLFELFFCAYLHYFLCLMCFIVLRNVLNPSLCFLSITFIVLRNVRIVSLCSLCSSVSIVFTVFLNVALRS